MAPSGPFPLEGGCDCGRVRYRMLTEPLFVHCCHCRWCQRESGAAFALNAVIEADRVVSSGAGPERVDTPSASGRGQAIARCPVCRLALWSNYADAGALVRFVRVGTLDEPDRLAPDIHIFTQSRQPWVLLAPDTPAVPQYYDRARYWPASSLARWEALQAQRAAQHASLPLPSDAPGAAGAARSALLVIDVQQGICEGAHVSFGSDRLIARINQLSARARAAGAPVFFIQHETDQGVFAHGSRGWQLAGGLESHAGDVFVRKATADAFHRTELARLLRARAITELVVCGLHSEFCVDTTVRRALALGFAVALVADGHSTEDKAHLGAAAIIGHHNATLGAIASFGVRVRAVAADAVRFGS